MSAAHLYQIVERASTLAESLRLYPPQGTAEVDPAGLDWPAGEANIERWCQVVARGDWEQFYKRVEWGGWSINQMRTMMHSRLDLRSQPLPQWALTLEHIIQAAAAQRQQKPAQRQHAPLPISDASVSHATRDDGGQRTARSLFALSSATQALDPANPVPFQDVLLPMLAVARQKLFQQLERLVLQPHPLDSLTEQAYLHVEQGLLKHLADLCGPTLLAEFMNYGPRGQSVTALITKNARHQARDFHYQNFVRQLLEKGLIDFFQDYPALARLIAIRVDFWVDSTVEWLAHFHKDRAEIASMFGPQYDPLLHKVIAIEPALSDSHHRGRTVMALTFASGVKLLYKPKDVGLEAAYTAFLTWCNHEASTLSMKAFKVLNCQTHGWVECIEHQPCEDSAAAQRYFQRAGMLLCLVYVLNGTDCHFENLIASGEYPVLIDLEALMYHATEVAGETVLETHAAISAAYTLTQSVLRTGLLPRWQFNKNKHVAYDISGFSGGSTTLTTTMPCWQDINTDNMRKVRTTVSSPLRENIPILEGQALSPNNYLDKIVVGFEHMYRFFMERKNQLLAANGPLEAFQNQKVRFVFRATNVYSVTLKKALEPEVLRSGMRRSIALDILARAFLTTAHKPLHWPLLQAELSAMEQADIPCFGTNTDTDALMQGVAQPIEHYFSAPSYAQVVRKVQKLNEADLSQQSTIIASAIAASVKKVSAVPPGVEARRSPVMHAPMPDSAAQVHPITVADLVQEAHQIAQEIQRRAIHVHSGSVSWIGFEYSPEAECFNLQVLGNNLYDGSCGIALFLGALDYLRGTTEYHPMIYGALLSMRTLLKASRADFVKHYGQDLGIGGIVGLGSMIYSLVKLRHFLGDVSLLEDAQQLAQMLTPTCITADNQFDILSGSAGAILGLLALYQEIADPTLLATAHACGQHLISHQQQPTDGPKAWKTFAASPLTGFSHGASGIAYALLKLYAVTGHHRYRMAAEEGFAYERFVFSSEASNWPDFRQVGTAQQPPRYAASWCHGAPGIGLARLGALSLVNSDSLRAELAVALETTQQQGIQEMDNLCCGNFGRLEILLLASHKLACPALKTVVQQQVAALIEKSRRTGSYCSFAHLPRHVFNPSFFQGVAGIGYSLLRIAYPDKLPSILLLE